MSKHQYTNGVCYIIITIMIIITAFFTFGESFGLSASAQSMPYVDKLFSTDRVHTLDIVVNADDWQGMLDTAAEKEYISCTVVIDGEKFSTVGIRPKGNSSLSSVVSSDSDRYSFKIEFDHYKSGQTYYGLDKLALNNIIQDQTYLKDYLSYSLMNAFDAYAPLTSFIYITVNGEDFGLYLAVEGIEEGFAQRNFGSDFGYIYKPESMNMMGGGMMDGGSFIPEGNRSRQMADQPSASTSNIQLDTTPSPFLPDGESGAGDQQMEGPRGGGPGGMGGQKSNDVALIYNGEDYDNYSNIFDHAAFKITDADKDRLIASIKQLNEGVHIDEVVNIEEVLRYFVVHNFVLNFDSYTGSMMHNYYLYEKDGLLSMIAWDYNLAFGGFGGGGRGSDSADQATTLVNYPIDTPVSGIDMAERPMLYQLLNDSTYLDLYHEYFSAFLTTIFDSGYFENLMNDAVALISPYVEKDPTAFCTYEEFLAGAETLKEFCYLRAESVAGQLAGQLPISSEEQSQENSNFIDASHIDINTMGDNRQSGGFGRNPQNGQSPLESETQFPGNNFTGMSFMGTMPEAQMPPQGNGDFNRELSPDQNRQGPREMPGDPPNQEMSPSIQDDMELFTRDPNQDPINPMEGQGEIINDYDYPVTEPAMEETPEPANPQMTAIENPPENPGENTENNPSTENEEQDSNNNRNNWQNDPEMGNNSFTNNPQIRTPAMSNNNTQSNNDRRNENNRESTAKDYSSLYYFLASVGLLGAGMIFVKRFTI